MAAANQDHTLLTDNFIDVKKPTLCLCENIQNVFPNPDNNEHKHMQILLNADKRLQYCIIISLLSTLYCYNRITVLSIEGWGD